MIWFKVYEDGDFMGHYGYYVFDRDYIEGTIVKLSPLPPKMEFMILTRKDREFTLAHNSVKIIITYYQNILVH